MTTQAKARLRALGLAITLFGETQAQRSARLLQAEDDKGHHQDDFTLADGHNVVSHTSTRTSIRHVTYECLGSSLQIAYGLFDFDNVLVQVVKKFMAEIWDPGPVRNVRAKQWSSWKWTGRSRTSGTEDEFCCSHPWQGRGDAEFNMLEEG